MKLDGFSQKKVLLVITLLLLVLYALFQARFLILGPEIRITEPENGATLPSGVLILKGTGKNVSYISLNDRPIFLNGEGYWEEKLITEKGLTTYTVKARDRFGRETTETITFLVK